MVLLRTYVHAIDVTKHPSMGAGYRWAVMSGSDPTNLDLCANAGFELTLDAAITAGDQNGATGAGVGRLTGVEVIYDGVTQLDYDPQPPD